MGREIKRVPIDFSWPLDQTWAGFVNPHRGVKCDTCDGRGFTPEYQALEKDWYGWDEAGYSLGRYVGSQYRLTQEEVDLLVDRGRLTEIVSTYDSEKGRWVTKLNEDGSKYYPDASVVNEAAKHNSMLHDSSNCWIICKHRAEKQGIEIICPICEGGGQLWASPEIKQMHDDWEDIPPPEGEGWQVWETVGEGSPITPVFETPEELIEYLSTVGDVWRQKSGKPPYSREAAEAFVREEGWVPSAISNGSTFYEDIECAGKK